MELHRMGSAGTRSAAEDAFLRLELPEPLVNMHLLGREVDFHWPDRMVVVEVDGIHGRPWSVADDAARDAMLAAAGYTVLRFRAAEVHQRQDLVTARTAAALASSPGLRRAA
jgi:very-short-patch-repair endonuclease